MSDANQTAEAKMVPGCFCR